MLDYYQGTPCSWAVEDPSSAGLPDPGSPRLSVEGIASGSHLIPPTAARTIDLNGDGLLDLIVSWELGAGFLEASACGLAEDQVVGATHQLKGVWINVPGSDLGIPAPDDGWQLDTNLTSTLPTFWSSFQEVVDQNGGDSPDSARNPSILLANLNDRTSHVWMDDHGVRFAELNGDGRLDLLAYRVDAHNRQFERGAWFNTEAGWVEAPVEFHPPVPFVGEHIFEIEGAEAYTAGADTGARLVDINGDGLTDIIKTALPSSHTMQVDPSFSSEGVWFGTGSGWCGPAEGCARAAVYELPAGVSFTAEVSAAEYGGPLVEASPPAPVTRPTVLSSPFEFVDLNGDGLLDLLQLDGYQAGGLRAWIHDPGGSPTVWREDTRFAPTAGMASISIDGGTWAKQGVRLLDMDDDAMVDVVRNNDASAPSRFMSAASYSDLLASYDNGRGRQVQHVYRSPIELRESDFEGLTDPSPNGLAYTRWQHRPVVHQTTVSGVEIPTSTYTFSYALPRWCPVHRSDLGFEQLAVTNDQNGVVQLSEFIQSHGLAGRRSVHEVHEDGEILASSTYDFEIKDGSEVPGSVPGAFVGRLLGSESGLVTRALTISYDDVYGFNFVDSITTSRPTGTLTIERIPEPPDLTNWVVGLLHQETRLGPTGIVLSRARRDYLPGSALVTRVERDIQPRESGAALEDVAVTERTFDPFGNVTSLVDPVGRTWEICYDGDASFPSGEACDPLDPTQTTRSHVVAIRDPVGEVSRFERDLGTGAALLLELFNGDRSGTDLDAFARPAARWTQPVSHPDATELEIISYVDGTENPAGQPYRQVERLVGDGTSVTTAEYRDGSGRVTRLAYPTPDGWAAEMLSRDYRGRVAWTAPNVACGTDQHCTGVSPAVESRTILGYDGLDRLLSMQTPRGETSIDYDIILDFVTLHSYESALIFWPDESYEIRHLDGSRLMLVAQCVLHGVCGAGERTKFDYEPTGELATIWNANEDFTSDDNRLRYEYDTLGRLRAIDDPAGGSTSYAFDAAGNVVSTTNARGQQVDYEWDDLGRLEFVDRPGGDADITVQYDAHTRQKALTYVGTDIVTGHLYGDFGREARRVLASQGTTLLTDFEYDLLGRRIKIRYPDFSYIEYNHEGPYLTSVCESGNGCQQNTQWAELDYDHTGRLEKILDGHGTRRYEYDLVTRDLSGISFQADSTGEHWLDLDFGRDSLGRIDSVTDSHVGPLADGISASASFEYDAVGRLESWTWGGVETHFTYDKIGNLLGRGLSEPSDPPTYLYEDPTRPYWVTRNDETGEVYDHDADGNLVRRGDQFLEYDALGQLTCVGSSPGQCDTAEYGYDAMGHRAYEVADGQTRLFVEDLFEWNATTGEALLRIRAGDQVIAEQVREDGELRTDSEPTFLHWRVDRRDLLLALVCAGLLALLALAAASGATRVSVGAISALAGLAAVTIALPIGAGGGNGTVSRRWTYQDHLGTRVMLLSDAPDLIYRRVFEPFGRVAAESVGTEPYERILTGKHESVATRSSGSAGLEYFQARWYDPELAQFTSVDPIIGAVGDPLAHNPYTYVRADPMNRIDRDGRSFSMAIVMGPIGLSLVADASGMTPGNLWERGLLGPPPGGGGGGDDSTYEIGLLGTFFDTSAPSFDGIPDLGTLGLDDPGSGGAPVQVAQAGPEEAFFRYFMGDDEQIKRTLDQAAEDVASDFAEVAEVAVEFGMIVGGPAAIAGSARAAPHLAKVGQKVVARAVQGTQTAGFGSGLMAGAGHAYYGVPGGAPQIPGNDRFNAGSKFGSAVTKFGKLVVDTVLDAIK